MQARRCKPLPPTRIRGFSEAPIALPHLRESALQASEFRVQCLRDICVFAKSATPCLRGFRAGTVVAEEPHPYDNPNYYNSDYAIFAKPEHYAMSRS